MEKVGKYTPLTGFKTAGAGTATWCLADYNGKKYFIKRFLSLVKPNRDLGLPDEVLKVMQAQFERTYSHKEKLYKALREANASGTLVVPFELIFDGHHVCAVSDCVSEDIKPANVYLASEWQRIVVMRTLTSALCDVHNAGIVHSDMKPSNILIEYNAMRRYTLRLIDFDGSFFEQSPPTKATEVIGDQVYYSPEALRLFSGESIRLNRKTDIFALGLILHLLWSGSLPSFPTKNKTAAENVLQGATPLLDSTLPPPLKQLIVKMLAADPSARPDSKEVYTEIGSLLQHYQMPSQPEPGPVKKITPQKESPKKESPKKEPPKPEPPKKAEITILDRDVDGNEIGKRSVSAYYGSSVSLHARELDGYEAVGSTTKLIRVSKDGYVETPIIFNYRKINGTGGRPQHKAIAITAIAIMLLIVILVILMNNPQLTSKIANVVTGQQAILVDDSSSSNGTNHQSTNGGNSSAGFSSNNSGKTTSSSNQGTNNSSSSSGRSASNSGNNPSTSNQGTNNSSSSSGRSASNSGNNPSTSNQGTNNSSSSSGRSASNSGNNPSTSNQGRSYNSSSTGNSTSNSATRTPRVGEIVRFGHYEQDNNRSNGMEPIEWQVLEVNGREVLLISKLGLDVVQYHGQNTSVNWSNCYLHSWLKQTFLTQAFTNTERNALIRKTVPNDASQGNPNSGFIRAGGDNSLDTVFLLSYAEATTYFRNNEARRCRATAYAAAGPHKPYTENGYSSWWLRSPGRTDKKYSASAVGVQGNINYDIVNCFDNLIRPAMWVNLDKCSFY